MNGPYEPCGKMRTQLRWHYRVTKIVPVNMYNHGNTYYANIAFSVLFNLYLSVRQAAMINPVTCLMWKS